MSSMLEQAVIDAEALKEVAMKNAEAAVIEKYSDEIKEAVEQLLEDQEETEEAVVNEMAEPIVNEMPGAWSDGEELCGCPEDDQVVTINLDDLLPDAEAAAGESHEDAAEDIVGAEGENELNLEEAQEPELDLDEDMLAEIIEGLTVDIKPVKSGWAGTPQSKVELNGEQLLAHEQDDEVKEENETLRKAVKDLQEANISLQSTLDNNQKKIAKFEESVDYLTTTLQESNVTNAKLLYTNKVLTNSSLNERQKTQLAESLSKAESVEEAKVIYDTLQGAVGSTSNKQPAESLSEAVNKTSSTMLLSRREQNSDKQDGNASLRWRKLAGIE
jgi:gas vesicle protein